jgi:hypothetical protein
LKKAIWLRAIVPFTLLLVLFFGTPSAGANGEDPISSGNNDTDFLAEDAIAGQQLVLELLDPLYALVNPTEGGTRQTDDGSEYGFSGVIAHPLDDSLDIYWVGSVERKARLVLDEIPAGLTVTLHDARYRLFEMLDAVEKIVGRGTRDFTIISAGPESTGTGIWVEYSGDVEAATVSHFANELSGVSISSANKGAPLSFQARWSDTSPYFGGSGYFAAGNNCSTSFPVTSNNTGVKYLLTAFHCFEGLGTVGVTNENGTWATANDSATWRHPDIDAALIKPMIQSIAPKIYYGAWNTLNSEVLGAVGGNSVGTFACTDGANSGNHCLVIDRVNFSSYFADTGTTVHGLVIGHAPSGAVTSVGGDSGGPVTYPMPNGKFRAMGTILGGVADGPCPIVHIPTNNCTTQTVWVGAVTVSSEMGMTIFTQ